MLTPLKNAQEYSSNLWDYLVDMPYMPSRQDRDALVKEAESDSSRKKRVDLWDYFFQIRAEDVGKAQKKEISALEGAISTARQKLNEQKTKLESAQAHLLTELRRTESDLVSQTNGAKDQARERLHSSNTRRRTWGVIMALISLPFILATVYIVFFSLVNSQSPLANFWLYCCSGIGLPIGAIASFLIFTSYTISDEKLRQETTILIQSIQQRLKPRIAEAHQKISQISAQISGMQAEFETNCPGYEERIEVLKGQIRNLLSQIPPPVSDQQVETWLKEDLQQLAEVAILRSGLRDKLVRIQSAENPFCIRGPAELQISSLIPPPYRNTSSDRYKHFRARRFAVLADRTFVDFYGVYNIEFILVTNDILGTYGTFYDFVTGRQSGERTTSQHYIDVVSIITQKGYREIEMENGEKIAMDNVPSLTMTLASGDNIDVTFPDDDYFRQIKARHFDLAQWKFDPRIAADNAIKAVRSKVDDAKKKREINK